MESYNLLWTFALFSVSLGSDVNTIMNTRIKHSVQGQNVYRLKNGLSPSAFLAETNGIYSPTYDEFYKQRRTQYAKMASRNPFIPKAASPYIDPRFGAQVLPLPIIHKYTYSRQQRPVMSSSRLSRPLGQITAGASGMLPENSGIITARAGGTVFSNRGMAAAGAVAIANGPGAVLSAGAQTIIHGPTGIITASSNARTAGSGSKYNSVLRRPFPQFTNPQVVRNSGMHQGVNTNIFIKQGQHFIGPTNPLLNRPNPIINNPFDQRINGPKPTINGPMDPRNAGPNPIKGPINNEPVIPVKRPNNVVGRPADPITNLPVSGPIINPPPLINPTPVAMGLKQGPKGPQVNAIPNNPNDPLVFTRQADTWFWSGNMKSGPLRGAVPPQNK